RRLTTNAALCSISCAATVRRAGQRKRSSSGGAGGSLRKELAGSRLGGEPEVAVRQDRCDASAVGSLQKALLDQKRLEDVLDGVAFFAYRRREIVDAHGAAVELVQNASQELPVHDIESRSVDVEHFQRLVRDRTRDFAGRANLRIVTYPAQETIGDTRRST